MGKALFDGQLVAGHLVQYLYKHILGWPISFSDLGMVDEEFINSLRLLETMYRNGEDVEALCIDFTASQEVMGTKNEIELIKDGADVTVTNENCPEFMEAYCKYRMFDRVLPQLKELLLGFFDVIPEPLLTIFDFQELELLMCGLREIDMTDWMEHTEYSGEYCDIGGDHESCKWFWEVVSEFDHEMKAHLLQFVTGTSCVPSRGFRFLAGNDRFIWIRFSLGY
jgi:E3 ubiquitin-protein ligase NEDD4